MEISKNPAPDCESGIQGDKHHKLNNNTKNKKETFIPVDANYGLGCDERCWKILKLVTRKRKGLEVKEWKAVKWYSNLNNALNGLMNFKLRVSGIETFGALQKEQEKILAELSETFYLYIDGSSCRSKIKAEIMKDFNGGEISTPLMERLFSLLKLGEV